MSIYKCPATNCNRDFHLVEEALNHINCHEQSHKGCVVPGCGYRTPRLFSRHTRKKHRLSCKYPCYSCTRVFVRSSDRSQHSRDVHGSNNAFDLGRTISCDALNRFIDDQLQPDQSFNSVMSQTVNNICSFFRSEMLPREIIKGGSMGKGTAIRGKSDIDLLLILQESIVSNASELEEKLPDIKERIKEYLYNGQNLDFTVMPGTIVTTRFSVQFTVQRGTEEIKVDLLPTFNFTNEYSEMENDPGYLLPYYRASLAKLQVDFVSPKLANVKNLIRLVKYWLKEYVVRRSTHSRIPNSYVLELISIHLWERKNRPDRFDTLKAFHNVMEALSNNQSICAIWNDINYAQDMIPQHILLQRPLVMDPANPFNNVCHDLSWEEIQQKAEEALESPMLCSISSASWY